jgi:molybdopterin-guanine dinucleotide biosynthesis protein A
MGPPLIPGVAGALLAGGRASRLGGVPKGLLQLDGEPIVARSLRLFASLFDESLVVANDPAPYAALGARVVPDVLTGKGAPGGVHAALAAARSEWVFTAACDMPFLSAEAIRFLAERRGGAPAVLVRWRGRLEGLHALWSRACLPAIEARLRAGDPSLWDLARAVSARIVEEAAWREVDPDGRSFENVNTPEDAARLGLAHAR